MKKISSGRHLAVGLMVLVASVAGIIYAFQVLAQTSTSSGDTTPPSTPTQLFAYVNSYAQILISWATSTDNVGVAGYKVYRDGIEISWRPSDFSRTYSSTPLSAGTTYTYTVAAQDAAGNLSPQSASVSATVPSSGSATPSTTSTTSTPPPVPGDYPPNRGGSPLFGDLGHSVISISALLYPDPNGDKVKGIFDWGDGTTSEGRPEGTIVPDPQLITPASGGTRVSAEHSYSAIGIYNIKVKAVDATNLSSAWTSSESVTIGIAPNQPVLTATVSGSNVILNWTESSINVTGFKLYDLPSSGGWRLPDVGASVRTYTDSGRAPGTYTYFVQAYNLSGGGTTKIYSNISNVPSVTVVGSGIPTSTSITSPITTSTTTTQTTTQTQISVPASTPTSASTPPATQSSQTFTCPDGVIVPVGNTCPTLPTSTQSSPTSTQPTSTPITQCLQAGGLWCYSDYPVSLLGYCAPAKSTCERGDQAPRAILPQPPAVGLRASEQFLADRRAMLQDLRELERLVKRDIIEIDAKQLKVFKEKILSLKPGNEGDLSALQAYRDQITSLQSDAPTNTERESTIDPRQEARALQQLKQGLGLFERYIKTIETKVTKIEKSGITVDPTIKETTVSAKDMARRIKVAKAYSNVQDIVEQMPDVGQALNDALPRLEELLRLPRVLRLVDRRIADGERAIKQAAASAKRLKLDAVDNLEAMRGIITNAKSTVAAVKIGGTTEGLLDTLQEQVFDPLDEIFDLADHIRAVASVRQAVNKATANVKRYEARLRRLKAESEDRQTASELLVKFKEQLVELKALSTQKLTVDIGDQIIDKLNAIDDLKVELEDVLDLASPDDTQEQIKRFLSAPSEKIKPFKIEQLEQGVL